MATAPGSSRSTGVEQRHQQRREPARHLADERDPVVLQVEHGDEDDAGRHDDQRGGGAGDDAGEQQQPGDRPGGQRHGRTSSRSPRWPSTASTCSTKLLASGSAGTPSSFGSWPAATVRPTPTFRPMTMASEMLSTSGPRRSRRPTRSTTPTSRTSVARSPRASSEPATTPTVISVVAVNVAIVDVVLTLSRQARSAQQGVDGHRDHARVQADLHGQPGDRGVGHRLGHDHAPGGEPADQVGPQPLPPVAHEQRRPPEDAHGAGDGGGVVVRVGVHAAPPPSAATAACTVGNSRRTVSGRAVPAITSRTWPTSRAMANRTPCARGRRRAGRAPARR